MLCPTFNSLTDSHGIYILAVKLGGDNNFQFPNGFSLADNYKCLYLLIDDFQFPNGFSRRYLAVTSFGADAVFQFPNGFSPFDTEAYGLNKLPFNSLTDSHIKLSSLACLIISSFQFLNGFSRYLSISVATSIIYILSIP